MPVTMVTELVNIGTEPVTMVTEPVTIATIGKCINGGLVQVGTNSRMFTPATNSLYLTLGYNSSPKPISRQCTTPHSTATSL